MYKFSKLGLTSKLNEPPHRDSHRLNFTREEKHFFMNEALREAETSGDKGDLPVGAVVVRGHRIISRGRNRRVSSHFLQHAEIDCLAGLKAPETDRSQVAIFSTLEPCYMCFGAILTSRIGQIYFALPDFFSGCTQVARQGMYANDRIKMIEGGILELESFKLFLTHAPSVCKLLLQDRYAEYLQRL